MVLPDFAIMALLSTSLANLTITVPLAVGVNSPSMMAVFPAVAALVPLDAAGKSYAVRPWFVVCVVVVRLYTLWYMILVADGPFIDHLLPVVVAADVYQMNALNLYRSPVVTGKLKPVTSCMVFATALLLVTSEPKTT